MTGVEEIIDRARKLVEPDPATLNKARKAEELIKERLEELLKDYPELEYRFLGSYARDTWLPESLEIDVFILFPESYSFDELERLAIEIGKRAVDRYELRYAAHPYVHGVVSGVDVDVVPCYKLSNAERIKSAVDRTPFHHEWVRERIEGLENDVRLLKRFMKLINVYGAEYRIKGFSGYLCELLVIHYGSFLNTIRKAVRWRRNLVIDPERRKEYVKKDLEKLYVVDPVDKKRNVAANLSVDSLAKFVETCRIFLRKPSIDFFIPKTSSTDEIRLKEEIDGRFVYGVIFERPPVVEDNLYTQLEKAENKIADFLRDNEFTVLRSGHHAGEKCYLIFELLSGIISKVKKHYGPNFESYVNSMKFIEKNNEYSRFFENGRYVTFRRRKITEAGEFIRHSITTMYASMGKDISEFIRRGRVVDGQKLLEHEDLKPFLSEFLGVSE